MSPTWKPQVTWESFLQVNKQYQLLPVIAWPLSTYDEGHLGAKASKHYDSFIPQLSRWINETFITKAEQELYRCKWIAPFKPHERETLAMLHYPQRNQDVHFYEIHVHVSKVPGAQLKRWQTRKTVRKRGPSLIIRTEILTFSTCYKGVCCLYLKSLSGSQTI